MSILLLIYRVLQIILILIPGLVISAVICIVTLGFIEIEDCKEVMFNLLDKMDPSSNDNKYWK